MTKEELLKVFDMSEDEQGNWCCRNTNIKTCESLADLAFRLRNEVDDHGHTRHLIYRYLIKSGEIALLNCGCCHEPWWDWWMDSSQPIHWIIAALIAKESK